jgi:hypothetical protein
MDRHTKTSWLFSLTFPLYQLCPAKLNKCRPVQESRDAWSEPAIK